MKIRIQHLFFLCILCTLAVNSLAQQLRSGVMVSTPFASVSQQEYAEQQRARQEYEYQQFLKNFVPDNPWRAINGATNYIKTDGMEFCGKVVDISPDGIRVEGEYGKLATTSYQPDDLEYHDFFVANYPFSVVNDQIISSNTHQMASLAGTYTYSTVNGGSRTIPKLDYGVPCSPPDWYLKQQAAAAAAAQEADVIRITEAQRRSFNTVLKMATNGDASMQCSLGLRYLTGEGCETNREQGIYWLTQAANNGDLEASNKLATLKTSDLVHN